MGVARIKDLSDLHRFGANLRIECPECKRYAVYPRQQILDYFYRRRWNTAWELVGSRFRCEKCDHKGAEVSMAPWESAVERPTPPRPITEGEAMAQFRRNRG